MSLTKPEPPARLAPEDYYFEGGNMVFTAAYHLKRGTCCGSGCRHCPYEHRNVPGPASGKGQRAEDGAAAPEDAG